MLASQFVFHLALKRDEVESFDRYPFSLPAVKTLDRLELHPHVTFFVGENGSGKSTLLEALAVSLGFNAEGGSRSFNFGTRVSHSELHEHLRVAKGVKRWRDGWFLRAESFFNVATEIERLDEGPGGPRVIDAYGGRSLHEQSHGESFLKLMHERFGPRGLYLLDEPEAALSPQRQLDALRRLHELVRQGSQFVIATHSPLLMAYPDAWVYRFGAGGIERVRAEETAHFRVMREFMADPARMLAQLLNS
ncbi:AAA family ATPase [Roseateles cellulosilyticus]|uniref:AAA family ATPase n=1 Tax=Pelomonas cellulosilytica TaxID=2906762 RepID=A0ABS8XY10_9BURK|nr:AAA family ATPase [Pelomonas sp. P8]MCE4555661.1 AAA family ATPase [Pelomonas sp. P8]